MYRHRGVVLPQHQEEVTRPLCVSLSELLFVFATCPAVRALVHVCAAALRCSYPAVQTITPSQPTPSPQHLSTTLRFSLR